MKHNLQNRRRFTRQFYRGNHLCFALVMLNILLSVAAELLLSWLMRQLMDLCTGTGAGYTWMQLLVCGILVVGLFALSCGIAYFSKPRFLSRAVSQYRSFAFSELSKKAFPLFPGKILPFTSPP